MKAKSEEITTFVCKDENTVQIIHLFVCPEEDCNVFKSMIDGYGNFYIPNIDIAKPIKEQRFWSQGRVIGIFDGRVNEAEVKIKLESTGLISDNDEFRIIECSRDGIKFSSETGELEP